MMTAEVTFPATTVRITEKVNTTLFLLLKHFAFK